MTQPTDIDVLIVGAGPTGLTLACLLAKYGVSFRIVDRNKTTTDRSKALGIQARTLELYEQLGITAKALEQGHPATGLDLIVRGKRRAHVPLQAYGRGLTKYPYVLILEQSKTEHLLIEKLQALGHKVDWQHELIEVQAHPECVTVGLGHFERAVTLRAKYVVGADGAGSCLRHLLKIPFMGGTYENRFMLADVAMESSLSTEHVSLCLSAKGFAGFFPMVGTDRYRAIGTLSDRTPAVADAQFEVIAPQIQEQAAVPMHLSRPEWISTYKLHHRHAARFRVGRCFLAGDAAHVHSPAGAQGMNTGIQDAFNLAWKLNLVLNGTASENLLNTYQEERLPFAKTLVHTTDRVFGFVTNRHPLLHWLRLYVAPVLISWLTKLPVAQKFVFTMVSQIRIHYRKSSLSRHGGQRFQEYDFSDGGFHAFMMGSPEDQASAAALLRRHLGSQVKIHTLATYGDLHRLFLRYQVPQDGLILVRPDQYVAYISREIDLPDLANYLKRYFNENSKFAGREGLLDEELSL
jgi:2-polyprenyl-6-methoxyphenol hydroxylase-like FAD-dependent oxidoreductase